MTGEQNKALTGPRRKRRGPQWLNGPQRYVAGATGAIALVTSGFAVYDSTNGVGTAGLQVVGGVFLFLGLTGLIPKRLTVGGNSVEYGDFAEDVVEDALKSGEPELKEAVARQVLETADRRGVEAEGSESAREARRLLDRARAELHAMNTVAIIRENLPSGTIIFQHPELSSDRQIAFGRPTAAPSRQVAITVMYAPLRKRWLQNYLSTASRHDFGCYVFVGRGSELPIAASLRPPLFAVPWLGDQDTEQLRDVLARALRIAESGEAPDEGLGAGRGQ